MTSLVAELLEQCPRLSHLLHASASRLAIPSLAPEHLRRRVRVGARVSREDADSVATARIDRAHRTTGTVRILRTGGVATGRGAVDADTGISGRSGADATVVVVATRDESSAVRGGAAWGYWNSRGLALAGAARLTIAACVAASAAVVDVGLEVLASIGCSTAERGGGARAWADGCGGSSSFSGSGNR